MSHPSPIQIHSNVFLDPPVFLHNPVVIYPGCSLINCSIGAFSYVASHCSLQYIEIGRYCQLGAYVTTLAEHPVDWLTSHPFTYSNTFAPPYTGENLADFDVGDPIRIGNDVWVGNGAQILHGVTIGDGAVIGAGAVVTKDVPPFAIVGGVPAKLIRMKFDDALIERIQAIQWWQYNLIGKSIDWRHPSQALDQIEAMVTSGELVPHQLPFVTIDKPVTT